MDQSIYELSTAISGAIGFVAPFVLPFLFKLLNKIFKRELVKEEKRNVITYLAVAVSIGLIIARFSWTGEVWMDIQNLAFQLGSNFLIVKGMVQSIYEWLVKGLPEVDEYLEEKSK